jgi:hypothetical protein
LTPGDYPSIFTVAAGGSGGGGVSGGGGAVKKDAPKPAAPVETPPPSVGPDPTPVVVPGDAVTEDRLDRPRAHRARATRRGTLVRLTNRPRGALVLVTVYSQRGAHSAAEREFGRVVKRMRVRSSRVLIRVRRWDTARIVYRDGLSADSTELIVRAPKSKRTKARSHSKRAHTPQRYPALPGRPLSVHHDPRPDVRALDRPSLAPMRKFC